MAKTATAAPKLDVGFKAKKILKVTRKRGYQIVKMIIDDSEHGGTGSLPMTCAFTPEGWYIGEPKTAKVLCEKYGIKPQYRKPGIEICTIGYSSRRRKWYGWSHRAIAGFGLGSVVRKGDVIAKGTIETPVPVSGKPVKGGCEVSPAAIAQRRRRGFAVGFKPTTMADCKRMASLFADEVG